MQKLIATILFIFISIEHKITFYNILFRHQWNFSSNVQLKQCNSPAFKTKTSHLILQRTKWSILEIALPFTTKEKKMGEVELYRCAGCAVVAPLARLVDRDWHTPCSVAELLRRLEQRYGLKRTWRSIKPSIKPYVVKPYGHSILSIQLNCNTCQDRWNL